MVNSLPVETTAKTTVGFRGVDWAVEQKKSQQGHERRKKEQQCRSQRRKRRIEDRQLLSFLCFVVSDNENALKAIRMDGCDNFFRAVTTELTTFPDGMLSFDIGKKVALAELLEKFDTLKIRGTERHFNLQGWMHEAARADFYLIRPKLPSGSRESTVSSLSDGAFETINLSSHNISDEDAAVIIQAAVSAAFEEGVDRNLSCRKVFQYSGKIFRGDQSENIVAKANADKKIEWPESNNDGETDSFLSKKVIDKVYAVAYTAFLKQANALHLNKSQIKVLYKYCFVPLKPDGRMGNSA